MNHAGKVLISEKSLTKFLGFPGGHIRFIGYSEDRMSVTATIIHPDMPEVQEGEGLQIVEPEYHDWGFVTRIYPKPRLISRIKLGIRLFIKVVKGV